VKPTRPWLRALDLIVWFFDVLVMTRAEYDWLRIKRNRTEERHIHHFHGTGWPRTPLRIEADRLVFIFHSDGSNTDWGVRCVVKAIFPAPALQTKSKKVVCRCGVLVLCSSGDNLAHRRLLPLLSLPRVANAHRNRKNKNKNAGTTILPKDCIPLHTTNVHFTPGSSVSVVF